MDGRPLRILILSDGRPGHYNLANGIAAAIGRRRSTLVEWLDVRRKGWPGPVLATIQNLGLPPRHIMQHIYGIAPDSIPPADLIISAGAETLAANIALARLSQAPNIFYGSLRQFRAKDFTLILTSYIQNTSASNVVMALKPSARNPDSTAANPAQTTTPRHTTDVSPLYGLLIGGNTSGITFSETDWEALLRLLSDTHATSGAHWIVSNSRRTPEEVSTRLQQAAQQSNSLITKFIDVRDAGSGTLDCLFDQANAVLCTADSSSMISEAVWAKQALLTIAPEQYQITSNEQSYRDWLESQGWMKHAGIRNLTAAGVQSALETVRPMTENPLDILADLLERRVPQVFEIT